MMSVTLREMIPLRRSVRKYQARAVEEPLMEEIREFMAGLTPLFPEAAVEARFVRTEQASFLQKWKNPQFLAFFAAETDGALENVGFMYQQLDLFLQSKGLGSCWVGLGWLNDEVPAPQGMKLAVMMAFGWPDEVPQRSSAGEFKRRELAEIADRADERLACVRIAPSATNSQPWYFVHEGDVLHAFCVIHGLIKKRTLGRMNHIDMGIALAHLYVENPETFAFFRAEEAPALDGYYYVGSVKI